MYIDDPENQRVQRYCYYRRLSRPEFRALVGNPPTYTIWDDHDFATNDSWGGPEIDRPSWKRPVWATFTNNWPNPSFGGGVDRPGCWYSFSFGDVQFFLLDGRYYRTDPRSPSPSMLGAAQKAWLKTELACSQATFKVICSPVPWDFRTKGDSLDTWRGFADEREDIFSWISERRVGGVVLLSADRHRSDAWKIERPGVAYDLYEFNSSRLTNQHRHMLKEEAIFSYNEKPSFGLVSFNTKAADPWVRYEVVTIDGEHVHTVTVRLSQLQVTQGSDGR